jgi:hypothetical protein
LAARFSTRRNGAMTDRLTKALLFAIALGLWANALNPWVRPMAVQADDEMLKQVVSNVRSIDSDLGKIQKGTCSNGKIC